MLNKEVLEYYKNEYANFNHDKFMKGRPVEKVSTHIKELVDSHLEALEEIRKLKEAMNSVQRPLDAKFWSLISVIEDLEKEVAQLKGYIPIPLKF